MSRISFKSDDIIPPAGHVVMVARASLALIFFALLEEKIADDSVSKADDKLFMLSTSYHDEFDWFIMLMVVQEICILLDLLPKMCHSLIDCIVQIKINSINELIRLKVIRDSLELL